MNETQMDCTGPALAVGTVRGLRAFNVDSYGRLKAVAHPSIWKPGENVADCKADRPGPYSTIMTSYVRAMQSIDPSLALTAPRPAKCPGIAHPSCTCGFYAYHDGSKYDPGAVHGVIEGYGKTTVGRKGFRSEKARLLALALPGREKASRGEHLHWWAIAIAAVASLSNAAAMASHGVNWVRIAAAVVNGLIVAGNAFFAIRDARRRKTRNEKSLPLRELLERNYPDVAMFDDLKAMTNAFPPDRGEPSSPETDPDFWDRA